MAELVVTYLHRSSDYLLLWDSSLEYEESQDLEPK